VAAALLVAPTITAQEPQPGGLASSSRREAWRLAVRPNTTPVRCTGPEFGPTGPSPAAPTRKQKALAAWSGVVLSTLAGWPPAGPPSGISRRDRERVNFQHATIDGYFSERITGLFAR
jgi:hypothetical protein